MKLKILRKIRWGMAQNGEKRFWKKWLKDHDNDDEWLDLVLNYFDFKAGDNLENKTLVDIGSGPIGILTKLKARERIAVDPLPIESSDKTIHRIKSPGEKIPLDDGLADVVFIYNVLQHVQSPVEVLNEAKRLLKKNGSLYLLEQLNYPTNNTHPHSFKLEMFDRWVRENNFSVVKRKVEDDYCLEMPQNAPGSGYQVLSLVVKKAN